MEQLPLNVTLPDALGFSNFFVTPENEEVLAFLSSPFWPDFPQAFLFGGQGCGKSHLLQASCYQAQEQGLSAVYLSMKAFVAFGTDVLNGLDDSAGLLVVDDVDAVLSNRLWEEALFHLINRCRQHQQTLLLAASQNPHELKCVLPDLASRLLWGPIYQVDCLDGEQALITFQWRARQKGVSISDQAMTYISQHYPRDISGLMALLDKLDKISLKNTKKVTRQLVIDVLSDD